MRTTQVETQASERWMIRWALPVAWKQSGHLDARLAVSNAIASAVTISCRTPLTQQTTWEAKIGHLELRLCHACNRKGWYHCQTLLLVYPDLLFLTPSYFCSSSAFRGPRCGQCGEPLCFCRSRTSRYRLFLVYSRSSTRLFVKGQRAFQYTVIVRCRAK